VGLVGSDHRSHLRFVNLAWYAAYGSNTDDARFAAYLAGCRAPCEPADSRPCAIDLPLYFAGTRTRWGDGGVAFVRVERDATPTTLARAWLLPVERIAEVGAQENRAALDAAALDIDAVVELGVVPTFAGWYDAWVSCGAIDGIPVVTLTSSVGHRPISAPSRPYVHVVARGLRTTHGMTQKSVAEYLAPRTNLSVATLTEWQSGGSGYFGANE
jgi:hypothetical protein